MENTIFVEGNTGLIMDGETGDGPVYAVPMNNMLPNSEFGAMFWDWD